MFYKQFRFRDFKGIEDLTLDLKENVTTLIGLNESGKTTILEAIYCFEYGAEDLDAIDPDIASLHDRAQWIPIAQRADFNKDIKIQAIVGLDDRDKQGLASYMMAEHDLKLIELPDQVIISEEYSFSSSRFTDKKRRWAGLHFQGTKGNQRTPRSYKPASPEWYAAVSYLAERLPRIWYFPNFLFELPSKFLITDPPDESADLSYDEERADKDRFYRKIFENILRQTASTATLQSHIIDRAVSGQRSDQRNLDALLLAMSESVTATVFEGWNRIFGRETPAAQEVHIDVDTSADGTIWMELKIKGPDGYYDLSERSLGFRWFFMFVLMTSLLSGEKQVSKPIFLLDEPASNLHSSAQAELLKSFENLADRCHLVYATHSHHLINLRWLDSAHVIKNRALGSLEIADYLGTRMGAKTSISATKYRKFVADHPNQTSYFQPVLDLLDYQPSFLEPVPNVVLVEGKSDFYILRYIGEVVGVNSPIKTVPGTGAGSLDSLIQLHIGWGKSFIVLLDGDAEGIKQRSRYERKFGSLIEGRCVLLSEVCNDAQIKEAEDLLTSTDKTRLISSIFTGDTERPMAKKALHQAISELCAQRRAISLEDSTIERFQRVFENLYERLA
jgi:ABC-type cobalamin/Fe3+-siderophores transport system ATPase subunit